MDNVSYDNIILKRALTETSTEFYDIMNAAIFEEEPKLELSISLLSKSHEPTMTWKFRNIFPVRYSSPIMNATSNEVAMEELELAVESFVIVK
jgi:phage tail-like protein